MGCCEVKGKNLFLDDFQMNCEQLVKKAETSLGIDRCALSTYALGICRYRSDNRITKDQLSRAMNNLDIDTSFFNDKNHPKSVFFHKFLVSGNTLEKLEALGVLLIDGELKDKARILFQTYDRDCSKQIDMTEFYALVSDIFFISSIHLLDLAIASAAPEDRAPLVNYKSILEQQKTEIIKFYEHIFFYFSRDYIEFQAFVNSICGDGVKKMLSAQGCRSIAYEIYKSK